MLGEHEKAIPALEANVADNPDSYTRKNVLATAYSMVGKIKKTHTLVSEVLAEEPTSVLKGAATTHGFKDPKQLECVMDDLRKANVPKNASMNSHAP